MINPQIQKYEVSCMDYVIHTFYFKTIQISPLSTIIQN